MFISLRCHVYNVTSCFYTKLSFLCTPYLCTPYLSTPYLSTPYLSTPYLRYYATKLTGERHSTNIIFDDTGIVKLNILNQHLLFYKVKTLQEIERYIGIEEILYKISC